MQGYGYPARSLAPALFAEGNALTSLWIYFVGPALGSLVYETRSVATQKPRRLFSTNPDRATVITQAVKGALEQEARHVHEK
jgi:hypothetical protein